MDICDWLDDEAIEKLKEDREPFDAPSTHYTPKPNDLGKLIWLSGKQIIHLFYKLLTINTNFDNSLTVAVPEI